MNLAKILVVKHLNQQVRVQTQNNYHVLPVACGMQYLM